MKGTFDLVQNQFPNMDGMDKTVEKMVEVTGNAFSDIMTISLIASVVFFGCVVLVPLLLVVTISIFFY